MKAISIKSEGCVGCQACEMICSAVHGGGFNPRYSRIRVAGRIPLPKSPRVCIFCDEALCIDSCPSTSLSRENKGPIIVDSQTCNGCGVCVDTCPYNGMFFNAKDEVPISCDLCGGKPRCTNICPVDILSW